MEIIKHEITGRKIFKALGTIAVASIGVAMLLKGGNDGSQTLLPIPPSSTPIDSTAGIVCQEITGKINYASREVSKLAKKGGIAPGNLPDSVRLRVFKPDGTFNDEGARKALKTRTNKVLTRDIQQGGAVCLYNSQNPENLSPTFEQAKQLAGMK